MCVTTNTGTGSMGNAEPYRLTKKGDVKLDLTGLAADSWYRVDIDFSPDFDSARKQSRWYGTARAGAYAAEEPLQRWTHWMRRSSRAGSGATPRTTRCTCAWAGRAGTACG